ncbi:hypothetical protein QQ045_026903 [Rhodiola kirilowii]
MPFTLTKESETAVSESYVDDKRTFTLNKESKATVSEGRVDDKMTFTPSKESEAAVGEGCIDGKMDFTLRKESEAEAIRINVNEELIIHTETNEGDDFLDLHSGCPEGKSGEPSIELTLGQENIEKDNTQPDDVMNFDDLGLGDTDNWQLNENNGEGEPFLRQCSLDRENSSFVERRVEENIIVDDEMDDDDEEEEVDANDDEEEADDDANDEVEAGVDEETNLAEKFDSLHGIPSAHMYQAVDISQGAFGSPLSLLNESHMQQFVSHADTSSTPIWNKLKRAANRTVTGENERIRSDTWDHQEPSDFDRCMENIEHWMGKAKKLLEFAPVMHPQAEGNLVTIVIVAEQRSTKLKEVEDEFNLFAEQIMSPRDLQSKLDVADVSLKELKAELSNYMDSKTTHGDDMWLSIEKAVKEVESLKLAVSSIPTKLEHKKAKVVELRFKNGKMMGSQVGEMM